VIRKVLVANRGEITRRVFRTCRAMGIATVAVHSDPDARAPFVREADEAVPLGGAAPAESYLRIDAIVEAALRTGADAVHPGYGFLSEDVRFARACLGAGLVFVGPPPSAIEAMGSKLAAKAMMADAGVPVLPAAEVRPGDDGLADAAERMGWPLLVKASAGGGGRGMRVVRGREGLADAVVGAAREATAAFGDGTVFLEPWIEAPRHVEVQVMADRHGTVASLFERECSIQRRHQKVVEEAPSPAVDTELRARLGEAAVAAARAVGYEGAGTVELLLTDDGTFSFLEMNTRLQVEHPVTEGITGLDLVRLQLLVAAGEPLPPEAVSPRLEGHAIEARLYAEDPSAGYLPATGTLARFRVPEGDGVRVDAGVEDGSVVSPHYDPMLAKVIAVAPTRAEAAARLASALAGARLHGVTTNRDLLVGVLRSPDFLSGATDTAFLERHPAAELEAARRSPAGERASAAAAALALAAEARRRAPVLGTLPSGWRNNPSAFQEAAFSGREGRLDVAYRWGRDGVELRVGDEPLPARVWSSTPAGVDLELDGVRRRFEVHLVDGTAHVDGPLGSFSLGVLERLPVPVPEVAPGSLVAPMPGTVVRVAADPGAAVSAGEVLVVLEAMKMEHAVAAPGDGRVAEVRVAVGQVVDTGAVLAVVEAAD
jgi:propionyl-CoA carboxylase alpha chain